MSELALKLERLQARMDALGEPDLGVHEACGGMIGAMDIAINAINSVQEASPTTVAQNSGALSGDSGAAKEVFLKLEAAALTVSALVFKATAEPSVTYTLPDATAIPATNTLEYIIEPVLEDWDTTTLNWNNKPTDLGDSRIVRTTFAPTSGSIESSGGDFDYKLYVTSSPTAFWGFDGYALTAADIAAGRLIYGFRIQLSVGSTSLSYTTNGEINTTLEAASSTTVPIPTHYAMVL